MQKAIDKCINSKKNTISKILTSNGIAEDDAEIVGKVFSMIPKNKKLINQLNVVVENSDSRMEKQLQKCVLQNYLDSLIAGKPAKVTACASLIAHQISFYSNNINAVFAFSYALKIVKSLSSKFRMKKKRFFCSPLTEEFSKNHPDINLIALEYLHYTGKLELVKDDFDTLEIFLELMNKNHK
jgi:hypothetical protein